MALKRHGMVHVPHCPPHGTTYPALQHEPRHTLHGCNMRVWSVRVCVYVFDTPRAPELADLAGQVGVHGPIEGHDAAEGADGVGADLRGSASSTP